MNISSDDRQTAKKGKSTVKLVHVTCVLLNTKSSESEAIIDDVTYEEWHLIHLLKISRHIRINIHFHKAYEPQVHPTYNASDICMFLSGGGGRGGF